MKLAGESKTERATPKKRRDERKKGNVFTSKDVTSVLSLLCVFYFIEFMFPTIYSTLSNYIYNQMGYIGSTITITESVMNVIFYDFITVFAIVGLPILLMSMVVSIIVTGAQTRFVFSGEALKPKFSRMNPIQGFGKMFSKRSFVEILKGLVKISIIGFILYDFYIDQLVPIANTLTQDLMSACMFLFSAMMELVTSVIVIFVFVAALDYLYQWWEYEEQIKMSKHDIKEEYKQLEGDPQVKGKIKQKQRQMAMTRMMQQVPSADVVIKNPTHYAVALKYDTEKNGAPIVVAKGQDLVAKKIIEVAEENGVFVTENVMLARALYASVDLEREIPMELYNAVAEVMAVVFTLRQKKKNTTSLIN